MGGLTSSLAGALKDASAMIANDVMDKILTHVILVICGTLTKIVPLATLVNIAKEFIAN